MSARAAASLRTRARMAAADALRLPEPGSRAAAAHRAACAAFDEAWTAARAEVEAQGAIACAAGCAACCHQHVAVHAVEAVAIADALARADAAPLRARLAATDARTGAMDAAMRRLARTPCAFLDAGGSCAIYEARPLRCRGLQSRDAALCHSQAADPAAAAAERAARVGEHPAFPRLPMELADAALTGLATAAADARGIAADGLELGRAVQILLMEPTRAAAVMAGLDDLAEARLDLAQRQVAGP